jgi:excisionase family DNA binding protein
MRGLLVTTHTSAVEEARASGPVPVQRHLFTVKEAAAVLGVNKRTVQRMVADGRLDSLRVGFNRFITREALRGYLAEAWLNPETREYVEELLRKPADPQEEARS